MDCGNVKPRLLILPSALSKAFSLAVRPVGVSPASWEQTSAPQML